MSNLPISSLPVAIALDGSELVPLVQGGTTKRATVGDISTFPASAASFVMATSTPGLTQSRLLSSQAGVLTITDGGPLSTISVGVLDNGIGNTQIRQGIAFSVIGNATNATANVADIAATNDNQILRRSGTSIGFGSIDLSQANAVGASILQPANGGTGVNNGSHTLTLGGNLTTAGAFASTFTMTGATSVTFPTSGTLATTAGASIPAVVQGDLLYGSAANVLSTLPKNTTATRYLANTGSSNNPNWDQVNLTNGVTGTLPVGNGGTGLTSGTSGGILGFTASNTLASSVALTQHALVVGGGAGATPTPLASLGTSTTVLHGNASGDPTFGAVSLTADVSGILPLANGGTNANLTASNGGLVYSTASALAILAGTATANQIPLSGSSTTPSWSTATYPSTAAAGTVLAAGAANTIAATATPTLGANGGTGGQVTLNGSTSGSVALRVAAAAGTGTVFQFPATNGSNTNVLQTDGSGNTSWVAAGAGTVTSVATNGGVTGGTITTSGTIQADPAYLTGFANCTLAVSAAASALTIALKDNAGNDPSASSPAYINFRNVTGTTGSTTAISVTAATSLVISSGSTLGVTSSTAFRLWVVGFNDGGTFRLGVINCLSGTNIFPLGKTPIASSTAEGGAGGADSAQVFYTGTAVTNKAYQILGYLEWSSSGVTAGTWTTTNLLFVQPYFHGLPMPGVVVQTARNETGAVATGTTLIPFDNTIPQNTEGDQYMTQAITPTSAANPLRVKVGAFLGNNNGTGIITTMALFEDSIANALAAVTAQVGSTAATGMPSYFSINKMVFPNLSSSTTFKMRAGGSSASTLTFNGANGSQDFGGVANSYIEIEEIMG